MRAREDLTAKYEAKKVDWQLTEDSIWGQEGERKVRLIQEHSVYGGMVEAMDLAIGRVLDKLKDLGLDKNTVIVFTSDNGGLSTSEGHPTSNLPLRAGKGWLYEGGIREPLIIKWPGVTEPNSKSNVPITSTDYYPTFLEMGGLDLEPQQHLDGVSLLPVLHGEAQAPRAIFWHYPHYGNQGGSPGSAVRYGDYKLIRFYEDGHQELYNLKEDIGEQVDLIDREPEKVAELSGMLDNWLEEVGARMPTENTGSSSAAGLNRLGCYEINALQA